MNWWERHKEKRKKKETAVLAAMRVAEFSYAHPNADYTHVCARCGHEVVLYPSGQKVMREHTSVIVLCNRCAPHSGGWPLAPGAAQEPLQSTRRR